MLARWPEANHEGATFAFERLPRFHSTKPRASEQYISSYPLQHSLVFLPAQYLKVVLEGTEVGRTVLLYP